MRRLIATAIVVMTLFGTSISPSHAIFGLSKCEKVKKEISVLEKQMTDVHEKGLGYTYEQTYFKEKQKIWEPDSATVKMFKKVIANDPIPKIWKLATNNPKCFTNTQKMHIKEMQNLTYSNYFTYPNGITKYKNSGECKTLMENNSYTYDKYKFFTPDKLTKYILTECNLGIVDTISTKMLYKSVYEY